MLLWLTDTIYMCNRSEEFVNHLMLHCEIIGTGWNVISSSVGLVWVMLKRVIDGGVCNKPQDVTA